MSELVDALRQLANARAFLRTEQYIVAEWEDKLHKTYEWERLEEIRSVLANTKAIVAQNEATVRGLILQAFAETGNKKPAPGAGIRMKTNVKYVVADLRDWALAHANFLLVLDPKKVDKMAEDLAGAPIEIEYIPETTIATDLGAYLEE